MYIIVTNVIDAYLDAFVVRLILKFHWQSPLRCHVRKMFEREMIFKHTLGAPASLGSVVFPGVRVRHFISTVAKRCVISVTLVT